MWTVLAERLDPGRQRPCLAADAETATLEVSGRDPIVVLRNARDVSFYRLTPDDASLLPLFDGRRTVNEIVLDRLATGGGLDASGVAGLARVLEQGGFLSAGYLDVGATLSAALHPPTVSGRLAAFLRTLTVEWSGAERLVQFLYRHVLRYVFSRVGVAIAAVVTVLGAAAFASVTRTHDYGIQNRHFGVVFAILAALDLIIIFIHELGHAAVLVHFQRRVKSAGFRIYFGAPSFFIDSSDAVMLSRGKRMLQAAAGPGLEIVGTSVAAITLWAFPTSTSANVLFQFVIINYFVLFLNLVPFLELDGYWILSDALRLPDLRPDSLAFVRRDLWFTLARRERLTHRQVGLAAYGIAGVLFTIAAFGSAWFFWRRVFGDTLLTMWHGGATGKLLLIIVLAFVLGPVVRASTLTLRSLARTVLARAHVIVFRLQSRWRVEAAQLLDASGLFGDVPVEVLNDVAGRIRLRTVPRGGVLIQQGDTADAFYLVRRGTFDVVENGATGVLRTVRRGEGFGEFGLLEGAPRTATVRAAERGEVFVLAKGAFERLLAGRAVGAAFAPTLQQLHELAALPPFAHLAADDLRLLAAQGTWIAVAPGQTIMTQGEGGDAFYVIGSGRLDIIENGTTIATRSAGEHVGERALLCESPRAATVRAATPTRLFRLDRDGFTTFVAAGFHRGTLRLNDAQSQPHQH
ncbi:cyclic nucleotide-binding domain-containing protein [Jatrophihabitans telluris]|uniref:Cyclic nucleotide-binding domain-containing protein n=1 Tax=Jatrophihabitans telluris TaxID=2038343 RepID=A0ABY4R2B2_9ACTN|nr:cyclic nucleotide-binding domain-containing protein [Jatrophihabitans telluris]UQX89280.1 cyclic nucleotide-binding domain-containing protein [Jatrophihabitans telluris]